MMRTIVATAVLALAMMAAATVAPAARAQAGIAVVADEADNEFPVGVTFNLSFTSPADPGEVRLRYRLAPDGVGASAVAECTGGATTSCTYTLRSGRGIFIIPGAEITYHWDVEDSEGDTLATEEKLYVHEDTRFTFEPVQQDNVTVYYHSGLETQARSVLQASIEAIERVSELEQTEVTFPVKVFLYTTAEEMQPAIASGGGEGRGVSVLGEVVYSDTAMVSADVATLDIARHEVAHIVTRQATKGPFEVPGWLNEGISVYSQSRMLSNQEAALNSAIERDAVLTYRELNSSASGGSGSTVSLYYAQSGSIVRFLVETYGAEKFAELLRTFKDGSTTDKAFETVYGFDQLGMENAWRESVGLPPRVETRRTPEAGSTEEARGEATPEPDGNGESRTSGGDGDGVPVVTIAVIVALTALLLAAIAGAASVVMRRL